MWLTVGSLAGSGSIAATGGPGEWVDGGGGSGGRIALYHSGSTFSGSITAFGGGGHQRGGAGTLFLKAATESTGQIIVHNGGVLGGHTPIEWPDPLHLSLGGLAQVYPPSTLVLRQLDVLTNGILTHPVGRTRCDVVVLGDATVHPGGRVSVDGRGYPWGSDPGPGAGRLVDWAGSGAGHGGTGGRSVTGTPGGPAYGSALEPATLGSQGGNGNGGSGSPGGGAVRLLVGGTLTVDGEVSARGINAIANNAGGGSGGSLLLGARVLAGSGLITASGGNGEWLEGGGGSGGRIALLHGAGSFAGTLSNEGGVGADRGESGSIVVDSAPRVFWLTPTEPWLHGTVPLEVGIFSGGTGPYSVRFSARQGGIETPIATVSATLLGTATWDSTVVVDGTYELHAIVRDTAGLVIDDVHRTVQVNNSVQWEGGILMGAATWLPDRVHVVSRDLVIPAGAQLTLAPGTIVKFLPGIRLILESAGILNAAGSAGAPVVLTSFLDDSAGGDSNLDGPASRPVAGSWRLIERAGATLSLNEHTVFRYHSRVYGGLLAGDETWSAETLREISETVVVPGGATLRLEAGVILKFNRDQGITVRDGGTLEVAGTAPLPVVFTSIADDAYGGDTNGDGTRSNPATGDWRSVRFENGSTGLLDHVEIRFGGNSVGNPWGAGGAIESLGGPLTVRNTVISDALKDGAFCYGTTRFENCLVLRCDRGLTAVGDMEVVHCTVDECRIGLLEHVGRLTVRNSIVSRSIDSGIEHDLGSGVAVVTFCNVWNPNAGRGNYSGLTDRTGTNGNISQEPLYKDSEFDNFRLGFASPGIDAADGTVASATDLAGASRYDDPRTTNTGSAAANGAPPDMGALEFVETAPSNIDLVVTRVEGPSRLTAGGLVQVEWTIANRGSEPFRGPWHDAVYLQPIGGGSRLWVAEPLVGRGLVVGPGETQRLSADVRVPGGLIDGYQWTVVGNSRGDLVEGVNTANNQASSATTSELIVPELVVDGAAVQAAFTAPEETHWFVCRAPVGHDVRLRLDLLAESGVTEVYAGHGFVPTPDRFTARQREFGAPDSSLVVSGSVDPSPDGTNVFYIAAVGRVLAATPESFRIEAQGAGFQIESVAPARAGSSGLVTLEIRGSGLDANTAFAVRLGTLERPAVRISARESGRVFATFDLTEFPAGLAQVTATQGGLSIALPDAIEVVSGGNADFYATLEGPEVTRAGRLTTWFVTYGNRGLIDVRLPLLRFSAPGATEIRLFDHTANWADAFTFLALNPNVLLPTLGPGQEVTLEVRLKVARPTRISLQHLPGDQLVVDDTPFRWSSIPVPAGANAANWASMLATLPRRLGATVADYVSLLERDLGERRKSMLSYSYLANVNGRWLTGDEQEGTPVEYPIIEISAEEAAAADAVGPALQGPPARPPADGIRKTWFLYFVIGDYSLRRAEGGGGGDVTATRKDAVDVNEYLTHELRVPPAQISGGYDAPGDNAAWNRANILAQLTKFAGQIDADDNLVIVYSGHGGRGPNAGTGFLCPNGGGSISPTAFTRAIDQVGAGTTYFINNSCHSEAFNELVRPSNTRFVGFAATRRDRVAFADSASGSPAISFLKAQLRKCRGLGTAFEITELLVAHKHSKNAIEKHRQHPVLHNPSGVDLAGKPWNDPAGLEQELERMFNEADFPEWDSTDLGIVGSIDPNDKYALAGAGPERWVHPGQALPYEVVFENKTNAPAAAQEVLVFDDLDPRYDWSTFELKSIAFNDAKIDVPPGLQRHTTTATVGTDTNEVAVEVSFNPATGRITWLLRSVDANTGDLPEDPYAGFLPPNDAAHRGEGSLTYTVRPKADLPDGTQLTNLATIIFDPTYGANPPIVTPMVTNTLDRFAPSSRIGALDASVTREFAVTWSGEDPPNGSGVASYDVHVSRDDGSYTLWQVATTNTTAGFSGQPGSTYRFFSIARDAAGNTELAPGEPDAVTTVTGGVTFTDWARIQSFPLSLAGPEQDPDNDGLPNFAEYALALNPMADDAEQAVPGAGLVEIAGQWYLTLTYRHPKADPPDVRYRVTASRNARPWDRSAMYLPMGTPIDRGTHVEVTVRAIEPIGFRNRGFLRIEITEGANP
ncbi:MAG: caspase family protein [Limisphaerales bacterium]